ncbi:GerAB/ArcD/ProY family transporter [Guptibacillus hwajinpoensis]|uniref:GerAB/ArcD/ProY family transporter n=1 Tax=Guptibacillus hwajinpoensis TaxID=208199 RepID=UPI003734FFDA
MNEKQPSLPIIIFLISTIIGVGIVTLPRQTALIVGQPNMWVSVIFGSIVAFLNACLIFMLIKRFPKQTLFDFAPKVVGKWVGKLFSLIFIMYAICISAFIIRTMSEIVNYYLLDRTPKAVVLAVLVLSCMYLVSSGLSNILMFFQLYFPIIISMFIILTFLSIKSIEVTHLRPIFVNDGLALLKGTNTTFFSFVGYELIMVLSGYQTFTKWRFMTKILGISLGSVCAIYVLFFVLNIGILSIGELKVITFPTIEMAKTIEYQGFFFERFELLFLFGWIVTIFTTLTAYYYSALLGVCKIINCKRNIWLNILVGTAIFSLALVPTGITELFSSATYLNNLSYAALIGIPFILLVVSFAKERFQ